MGKLGISVGQEALMRTISRKTGFTKLQIGMALEKFAELVSEGLKEHKKVVIARLGVLKVQTRPGGTALSPGSGKIVNYPAKCWVKFAPHRNMRRF